MRDTKKGFTLVELLVALMITSIIMGAVATLTFAVGKANDSSNDTSKKQAQLRFATLRITELLRGCKLICNVTSEDMVIWKADDSPANGKIDVVELAYIEAGTGQNFIKILEFSACPALLADNFRNQSTQISSLQNNHDYWKSQFVSNCTYSRLAAIPQCSNVQFYWEPVSAGYPSQIRFVCISFDLAEDGYDSSYRISSSLKARAGNLLNAGGELTSDDD